VTRSDGSGPVRRLGIAIGATAGVLSLIALVRVVERAERRSRPNVLVIGIDTLRADRLGCYGYGRPTSPHLDALARESVLFERAISQSPWTLPAFASIFTGVLPSTHGAGRGRGQAVEHFDGGRPTLATLLRDAGYRTASFVTNGWVSADVGMAGGVDTEDTLLWIDSSGTQAAALKWLRANVAWPFYMFLHVVDPHGPYDPAPEHLAALGVRVDAARRERVNAVAGTLRPMSDLLQGDRAALSDLYDAEVRQADARVGAVVAELRRLGLLERTIVVVVSDHGEELLDRGGIGHGHSLHDELLHVPLLVRLPGGRWARRAPEQVRTMDVLPTLLELVDVAPPPKLDGRSLVPRMRDERSGGRAPGAPSEFLWKGNEQKSLRHADGKVVLEPATGNLVWYDLPRDPRELRKLAADQGRGAVLKQELERVFATRLDGVLVSVSGDGRGHFVQLVLETASRFEEAALEGGERDDRLRVSESRQRAEAQLILQRSHDPGAWIDADAIRVRTAGDAPVRLRGTLDGSPISPAIVRLGEKRLVPAERQPWTLAPADPRIVVSAGYRPVRDPYVPPPQPGRARHHTGVRIAVTARFAEPVQQRPLAPETERSLRALGYLD